MSNGLKYCMDCINKCDCVMCCNLSRFVPPLWFSKRNDIKPAHIDEIKSHIWIGMIVQFLSKKNTLSLPLLWPIDQFIECFRSEISCNETKNSIVLIVFMIIFLQFKNLFSLIKFNENNTWKMTIYRTRLNVRWNSSLRPQCWLFARPIFIYYPAGFSFNISQANTSRSDSGPLRTYLWIFIIIFWILWLAWRIHTLSHPCILFTWFERLSKTKMKEVLIAWN